MAVLFGFAKQITVLKLPFLFQHSQGISQPVRQFKSALKIKFVRPEKIPCILPEQSGDLEPLGTIDLAQFPTVHKESKELQSANKLVQKINTLEFFHRSKLKEEFLIAYANRVKAHRYDDSSPELKIAYLTVTIRNLQIHMVHHRTDKVNKVRLKQAIENRDKKLRVLRKTDYKKFEWLLERLDLIHKVYTFNMHERVERKRSLRRLTAMYIEKLKSERLAEYKVFLESKQEDFLKHKIEMLEWVRHTETECGVAPTVTDEDIKAVHEQLRNLIIARGSPDQDNKQKHIAGEVVKRKLIPSGDGQSVSTTE